ncbi:MAG TPA: FtsL-like putative cell division protein [Flavobacteriales bacterium]|nr:FtsL-like putative cell division protein [Flavobacteriales bacterium]HRE95393.1 FtsL-like putative cell division protein [Flavobacteriales bacterium]HRJ38093.1 FtsL-like putative cell division protein [Flavobacteriales bacterium]
MNKYKVAKKESTKKARKEPRVVRSFRDVLNGNVLTRDYVVDNLPYFFFLTVLMLVYIAMGYTTDKNARRIERIESELVELNSEYISVKTELNLISRQSQIADSTASIGLFEMKDESPRVIRVSENQLKTIY